MAKKIKYFMSDSNTSIEMPWSERNEEIAKTESANGEYEVIDDGIEEIKPLSLDDRIKALERMATPNPYEVGKWYYRGDKVLFEEKTYTCVAPEGVVCVWSPVEYPTYWQKEV